ncbi:MAG: LamG domain-containing protein [Myxococcales bacterium]|nr:LamG domain-containing protein [Myxococcales bacterium]
MTTSQPIHTRTHRRRRLWPRLGPQLLGAALGAATGVTLACQSGVFQCSSDAECGTDGTCQGDGYCSFPSGECESGQEYGQYAPAELAGTCVPVDVPEASTGDSTPPVGEVSGQPPPDDTGVLDEGEVGTSTGPEPTTGVELTTGVDPTGEPPPLDPSLVLWLTFDEVGGDIVPDQSDYGNDAECYASCPELDGGISGSAAYFGQQALLGVRFNDDFYTPDGFTVAAWVRPDVISGEPMAITELPFSEGVNSNWNSWELRLEGDAGADYSLFFATTDGGSQAVIELQPAPYDPGQWIHLAGVWDGELLQLYVDGQPEGASDGYNPEFDGHDILIGGGLQEGMLNDFFVGAIDDYRLYARPLDGSEIALLAQGI